MKLTQALDQAEAREKKLVSNIKKIEAKQLHCEKVIKNL